VREEEAKRVAALVKGLGLTIGVGGLVVVVFAGGMLLEFGFGKQFSEAHRALVAMMFAVSLALSSASFGGFVQAFCSPKKLLHVYIKSFNETSDHIYWQEWATLSGTAKVVPERLCAIAKSFSFPRSCRWRTCNPRFRLWDGRCSKTTSCSKAHRRGNRRGGC